MSKVSVALQGDRASPPLSERSDPSKNGGRCIEITQANLVTAL